MRPPERINRILEKIRERWKESPDLRLCQLLSIAAWKSGWESCDLFNLEDNSLEEGLALFAETSAHPVNNYSPPPSSMTVIYEKSGITIRAMRNERECYSKFEISYRSLQGSWDHTLSHVQVNDLRLKEWQEALITLSQKLGEFVENSRH